MSSPEAHPVACAPTAHPVFPDEILEEIFLRLDATEDLARASAACTAFHRIVSGRRFLRRFRCHHPPPVLGVLQFGAPGSVSFHPAEPPHRSAPAARAVARAADLTFSSICTNHPWQVCDARDGRVLLYLQVRVNLMVFDPLHRRQVRLPRIPNDLAFSSAIKGFDLLALDAFLDPATDIEKEKQDLSFRVICAVKNQHNIVTFHFSSATGKWRSITFNTPVRLPPRFIFNISEPYYAHGCFFWSTGGASSFVVMLNMHDMKLSVVDLPPATHDEKQAIVEAGEGTIRLVTLSVDRLQLYCKSLQGTEWQHERIISLPKLNCYWKFHNAAAGYLLLQATSMLGEQKSHYFTLNLKTFVVERLCISSWHVFRARLYASFLLPFSEPSI